MEHCVTAENRLRENYSGKLQHVHERMQHEFQFNSNPTASEMEDIFFCFEYAVDFQLTNKQKNDKAPIIGTMGREHRALIEFRFVN